MIALISLLSAVTISILIGRVATQAFEMTGLSHDAARFQARSALTGTGFTTSEAESVVDHPVRRRILMVLMVLQSAGLVTLVSTFVLSFVDTGGAGGALRRAGILVSGLLSLQEDYSIGAPRGRYRVHGEDLERERRRGSVESTES